MPCFKVLSAALAVLPLASATFIVGIKPFTTSVTISAPATTLSVGFTTESTKAVVENLWISFGIATPADHRGNTTLGKPLGNVDLLGLGEEFPTGNFVVPVKVTPDDVYAGSGSYVITAFVLRVDGGQGAGGTVVTFTDVESYSTALNVTLNA